MTDSDDREGIDALVSDIDDILAGEESEEHISFESEQGGLGVDSIPTEEEEEEGSQVISDRGSTNSADNDDDRTLPMATFNNPNQTANATSTITVGGLTFEVKDVAPVRAMALSATKELKALHSMASRDGLTTDKLEAFFARATAKQSNVFNFFDLALDSAEKLEDTYDLQVLLNNAKEHLVTYDTHHVMTIMIYDDSDHKTILREVNLFEDHATVTLQDVARSNYWYSTLLSGNMERWMNQNLKLTYDFFVNNMDEQLKNKCAETYRDFPGDMKGGPLLFKIMMDELQINSDAAGQALIAILKKLRIDQLEGENVNKVVGLVRDAVS